MSEYEQTTRSEAILWHIQELTANIVAETGIPSDRHHLGKILLRSLKEAPDHIFQIDGGTDERETFKSALERSTRCATALRNLGLMYQDLILIMAPNHIHLVIPMYAALYCGYRFAGIDMTFGVNELKDTFEYCVPKVIFCQSSKVEIIQQALKFNKLSAQIISFDESNHCMSFSKFLHEYGEGNDVENFKPAEFDPEETDAFLIPTSGSTGLPKTAVIRHKSVIMSFPAGMHNRTTFPTPVKLGLIVSPLQWMTSILQFLMGSILRYTRLQTSAPMTPEHIYSVINKYRPEFSLMSPTFLTTLLKPGDRDKCDFSSFEYFMVGGSFVSNELVQELKKINSKVYVRSAYGITEATGFVFDTSYSPFGSLGVPLPYIQCRLVDPESNKQVHEPNVPAELRLKGPTVFRGYYNNPEMTKAAFDEEGWFKTGDILYRDEYHNYYFYDRIKMLLKYRNHQVSPVEIERVIMKHQAVLDVAVTGIPDFECGDLPVALVILRPGRSVTAQEIKDLVKETLTDTKQLHGGVIFVKEFPITSTSKLDRKKLKEWAKTLERE